MRSNAWETLRDPRFISQVQQFYRPMEYTARRPIGAINANGQGTAQPGQAPQSREGQPSGTPAQGTQAPGTAAPRSTAPDAGTMQPQPNDPQNPPRPRLEPEKGRSGQTDANGAQGAPDRSNADKRGADQRESKPLKDTEKADEEPSPSRLR